MEEQKRDRKEDHKLVLDCRSEATLTGIRDVISFDEKEIQLDSSCGRITVKGENLHVKKLTLENGEAKLEGSVSSIQYSQENGYVKNGQTLFSRLFQ